MIILYFFWLCELYMVVSELSKNGKNIHLLVDLVLILWRICFHWTFVLKSSIQLYKYTHLALEKNSGVHEISRLLQAPPAQDTALVHS